jgi:hypothetical protein
MVDHSEMIDEGKAVTGKDLVHSDGPVDGEVSTIKQILCIGGNRAADSARPWRERHWESSLRHMGFQSGKPCRSRLRYHRSRSIGRVM